MSKTGEALMVSKHIGFLEVISAAAVSVPVDLEGVQAADGGDKGDYAA
jgi:hypothetical protein